VGVPHAETVDSQADRRGIIRGAVYFALVFGAGFLLGIVRVLTLEPRLGARWAELVEAPLMLVVIVVSARFVVRRFPAPRGAGYLISGAIALLLLLLVELSVVLGMRGLTLSEYFAERDPVAGSVYVVLLIVFAAMPWLLGTSK
jgi:hypothetical protein